MIIKHAEPEDIEGIIKVGKKLLFDHLNPQIASISYVLKKDEYLYRINNSNHFYVSKDQNINGYLVCYDDKTLEKLAGDGMFHHDGILPYLNKQKKPYIYGETIAVDPQMIRKEVGSSMMQCLFSDMDTQGITSMHVLVRHHPLKNVPSIYFCKKLGFVFSGEEIVNKDGIFTWGIYTLCLKQQMPD